jgi:hypothetical protein
LLPNGIGLRRRGRLVVSDTGVGGDHLEPKIKAQPGILRLAIGARGNVSGHTFTPVSGGPNGVAWNSREKALYWVTCSGQGPEGGALYRNGKALALDLGPSDGIAFTPAGTVIVSRFKGDLVAIRKGGAPEPIPSTRLSSFPRTSNCIHWRTEARCWSCRSRKRGTRPLGSGIVAGSAPAGF